MLKDARTQWGSNRAVWYVAGLDADGIYRVSGNLAVIQKLRFLVDHGEDVKGNCSV